MFIRRTSYCAGEEFLQPKKQAALQAKKQATREAKAEKKAAREANNSPSARKSTVAGTLGRLFCGCIRTDEEPSFRRRMKVKAADTKSNSPQLDISVPLFNLKPIPKKNTSGTSHSLNSASPLSPQTSGAPFDNIPATPKSLNHGVQTNIRTASDRAKSEQEPSYHAISSPIEPQKCAEEERTPTLLTDAQSMPEQEPHKIHANRENNAPSIKSDNNSSCTTIEAAQSL